MSEIKITLPDKSVRSFDEGVTPLDVAQSIGPRLAKDTIVASIDGDLVDISRKIKSLLILFRTNTDIEIWDQNKKRIFEK